MIKRITIAMSLVLVAMNLNAAEPESLLAPGKRILFLGDSITHAGHYVSRLEAQLRTANPDAAPVLINLGLPSETCSGLSEPDHPFPRPNVHERIDRALAKVKPDVVFACYGMNDGIYYPFSDERFAAYQKGVNDIIAKVHASGAKLVLMTPPAFDAVPLRKKGDLRPAGAEKFAWFAIYEGYDDVLKKYAAWVMTLGERVDLVIDLHTQVNEYVAAKRKENPGFTMSPDGVHVNEEGHQVLAATILKALGSEPMEIDPKLLGLVHARQQILHAAWVSHVGHKRPDVAAGLPLDEAEAKAAELDRQIREQNRLRGRVTRWADDVDPNNVLPEYPRPQMVRDKWLNLNGHWQYAIRPKEQTQPEEFDGRILVPYPIESFLSGVEKRVDESSRLWYRRTFTVPGDWDGPRTLLHFGAVDWKASVWINGKHLGDHQGGYDPFSFDITAALQAGEEQELVVGVWDPTDTGSQPRGKQVKNPHGIWYTPVTGIWQTVWIEPVPKVYIRGLKIVPDVASGELSLGFEVIGQPPTTKTTVRVQAAGKTIAEVVSTEEGCVIPIPDVRLWSPDDPFLYDLTIATAQGDRVTSYFGMRSISIGKGANGFNRLLLNNEPVFQYGPLDQGWWPDGLYTAPTDEALRFDIEMTKKLGFNMARKHVKVEPARWYYWCDRLGLLVWQDMPSGFRQNSGQAIAPNQPEDAAFAPEEKAVFRRELQAMIDANHNSPSIVAWVPFNEGWGQHDTNEILQWTKQYDPTRLVDGPSGWQDRGWGDMKDLHRYPGPGMFPTEETRVSVLGEFGGLGLPIEGHTWVGSNNWGYRNYSTREALNESYANLLNQMPALIADGLAAAIYTQTTDVEIEVNGFMTYDRAIIKLDAERLAKLHARLYEPPGLRRTIVPTSEREPQTWRFTTTKPADGWEQGSFDDSQWTTGEGGFGTKITPNTTVRTEWNTSDIWLRRTFTLDETLSRPSLRLYHDEAAEVYINGVLVAQVKDYVVQYIELPLSDEALKSLRVGENTIAVHCHQTGGGQYIDAGLIDLVPASK